LPFYPEEERKAGIAGKMVLSITLNALAQLEEVHVLQSLSPGLDQEAIDAVRTWTFKPIDPNSKAPLKDLQLVFFFTTTCRPKP
jgi:TonB family protein